MEWWYAAGCVSWRAALTSREREQRAAGGVAAEEWRGGEERQTGEFEKRRSKAARDSRLLARKV